MESYQEEQLFGEIAELKKTVAEQGRCMTLLLAVSRAQNPKLHKTSIAKEIDKLPLGSGSNAKYLKKSAKKLIRVYLSN